MTLVAQESSRLSRGLAHMRDLLPQGGGLDPAVFARRHRALCAVLAAHVVGVIAFGLFRGYSPGAALLAGLPVAALWLAAKQPGLRSVRACLCAAGLVTASSVLVHLSGGLTEMHFHFFVVVALLTLYQDWTAFLTTLVLIVLEHGVVGVMVPRSVYDHSGAWSNPWLYALMHGAFVLAASAASISAWSINEKDHHRIQEHIEGLRRQREDELQHQTEHDPLTGLGNRRLLTETLSHALAEERNSLVALLFVDLDGFKSVNDMFGHDMGDHVLIEVGRRIDAGARSNDVTTRLGGDEFVVLCMELTDEKEALLIANRIEKAVSAPIASSVGDIRVTASVGIACSRDWPHNAERLLHEADLAMYRAKQLGKERCQLFDEELRSVIDERSRLEETLRSALDAERLQLHYQPIFDKGQIVSVEALLRLETEQGEPLLPAPYIAVAEETGLVSQVTRWVLREACRQTALWRSQGHSELVVNVNVSGREVGHDQLFDDVFGALQDARLEPSGLALEITETALLEAGPDQIRQLRDFLDAGVAVGMDDFGTGFTSLQQLRSLPISFLKVDKSFVDHLSTDRADRAIVAAIATLSHELDLDCVAEGVETAADHATLNGLGITHIQGYLLGRPMPAARMTEHLAIGTRVPMASAVPAPRGSARVSQG